AFSSTASECIQNAVNTAHETLLPFLVPRAKEQSLYCGHVFHDRRRWDTIRCGIAKPANSVNHPLVQIGLAAWVDYTVYSSAQDIDLGFKLAELLMPRTASRSEVSSELRVNSTS